MASADGTFPRNLPCILDPDQVALRAADLAECLVQIDQLDEALRRDKATHKDAVSNLRERVGKLATEVRNRQEFRDVPCTSRIVDEVDDAEPRFEVVRIDTGEVVESRPLTVAERQEHLFPGAPGQPLAPRAQGLGDDTPSEEAPR